MNQCDDDEKKSEKEKKYKSVFKISFSTTIIAVIIIIIIIVNIIVIIIIIEENEYENCVNHLEDFDILFICFVEFFASVSSLKKEDWKEVLKFECEEDLKEKFVCVVCFFAEFLVSKDAHSDCEFCDSILILFLLAVLESVTSFVISSISENFSNENQSSSALFFSLRREESEVKKKIIFTSCSFVCLSFASSVESLFIFVFFISESIEWSFVVLRSKKSEIIRKKEIKFLDEKIVIKSDVWNLCETSNSSFSSLEKSCVEIVEIEKKK